MEPWRDLKWISEYTGVPYRSLQQFATPAYRARSKNPIPVYKLQGRVVSKASIIDEWIMQSEYE